MNHNYAHCIDYRSNCPKRCFRAKLVREYEQYGKLAIYAFGFVSWGHFYGTEECMKSEKRRKWKDKRKKKR